MVSILSLQWIEKGWILEVLDNREKITLYYGSNNDAWIKYSQTKEQPKQVYFVHFSSENWSCLQESEIIHRLTLLIDGKEHKYYYDKQGFYPCL